MTPHQPANHGSPATNSSPSGIAAQSSPTGTAYPPPMPSALVTIAISTLTAMPRLLSRTSASASIMRRG